MRLSTDERRALGIVVGLLLLASLARWIERPQPLLSDVPGLDVAALEEASRAAKPPPRGARSTGAAARPGSAGGAGEADPRAHAAAVRAGGGTGPIDINAADEQTLQRLPGIGPAMAARIVAERAAGPFAGLDDLQRRVRGIGPALAARLAEHVTPSTGGGVVADRAPPAGAVPAAVPPPWPAATGTAAAPRDAAPTAVATRAPDTPVGTVAGAGVVALDLNRATAAELEKISGVGPILAARLVARRDSLGGFSDWSEVDAVPGVGPAMLARLKGLAVIGR